MSFAALVNHPDQFPDDDRVIERWKIIVLNRIDREWGCSAILNWSDGIPEYCTLPEHHPYSDRCKDHCKGASHG